MSFLMIAYPHASRLVYHEEHLRSPTVTRASVYNYRDATTHIGLWCGWILPVLAGSPTLCATNWRSRYLPLLSPFIRPLTGRRTAISLHAATTWLDFSITRVTN